MKIILLGSISKINRYCGAKLSATNCLKIVNAALAATSPLFTIFASKIQLFTTRLFLRLILIIFMMTVAMFIFDAAEAAICPNNGYCYALTSNDNGTRDSELAAIFSPRDPPEKIFASLFNFLLGFVGIGAMVMIVIEGIKYMTSAGDQSKIGEAKKRIWNAVWGLILALISYLLLQTINPDLLKPGLKSINLQKQGGLDSPAEYRDVSQPPELKEAREKGGVNVIFTKEPTDVLGTTARQKQQAVDSLRKECQSKNGNLVQNTPLGGGTISWSCVKQ